MSRCTKKNCPMNAETLNPECDLKSCPYRTEVSGDLISREQAINELKIAYFDKNLQSAKDDPCIVDAMTDWAIRIIKRLPPVTPKAKWIPVSKELPEDYIHVLCQFTLGGMGECYLAHGVFHVVGGLVMTCNEVIAWMPLPERYEPQESEEGVKTDGKN